MNIKPMSRRVIIQGDRLLSAVIAGTIIEVSDDLMSDEKFRIGKMIFVPADVALEIQINKEHCYIVKAEDVAAIKE